MSEEQASLQICNLVSRGMSIKDARAQVAKSNAPTGKTEAPKKKTTAEKKATITAEIEALNGEVPGEKESLAKFTEALTAAKVANAEKEQKEADDAQAIADKEQKEADDAAKELM